MDEPDKLPDRPVTKFWNPKPISPPALDPGVDGPDPLYRFQTILRYRLRRIEYALSPGGQLRQFLKLALLAGLVLLVLYPIVLLIVEIVTMVVNILLAVVGIVILGSVLVAMFRNR